MKNVLSVVGSLREASFNKELSEKAEELLKGSMNISRLTYADMPFMNQDLEADPPQAVGRAREAFLSADGVWFFTPEYNGMVPGPLKNLLDWMSRPLIPGDVQSGTALAGKAATVSGCGGGFATKRVRANLDELLKNCRMRVMTEPEVGVALPKECFGGSKWVIPKEVEEELLAQGEAFLKFMEQK